MKREFDVVVFPTHKDPHPDEFLARFLLEKLAEGVIGNPLTLPPVTIAPDATFIVWGGEGHLTPDGRDIRAWIEEGYLPLGIGGSASPYDDHTTDSRIRIPYCKTCAGSAKPRFCASDMVAFENGIADDPRIRRLLQYVHLNDCHGFSSQFDFSRVLAAEQRQNHRDPEEVYHDFRRLFLEPEFEQQAQLFGPAKSAYEACAKVLTFSVQRMGETQDRRLVVLDGMTDPLANTPRVAEYAKMEDRPKPAHHIVVLRDSNGHVQVMLSREADFDMKASAAVLRFLEWKARGAEGEVPSFEEMAVADNSDRVPNWHFQSETGHIFNGSLTHPDVQPTALDLDTIVAVLTQLTIPRNQKVIREWTDLDGLVETALYYYRRRNVVQDAGTTVISA